MLWTKEVELVDSLDELKSSRSFLWRGFSKFRDAEREDCFCSEQDHSEFAVQEEGQSRGTESPERGPVSTRKTDRLHELRLLSCNWCSWYSIGLCWSILCYPSWWEYSGIRYKMGRNSTIEVKDSPQWYLGMSVQLEYVSLRNSNQGVTSKSETDFG